MLRPASGLLLLPLGIFFGLLLVVFFLSGPWYGVIDWAITHKAATLTLLSHISPRVNPNSSNAFSSMLAPIYNKDCQRLLTSLTPIEGKALDLRRAA